MVTLTFAQDKEPQAVTSKIIRNTVVDDSGVCDMSLTRHQFDNACRSHIEHCSGDGWTWNTHHNLGYLTRVIMLSERTNFVTETDAELEEDTDLATASVGPSTLTCTQHVVYSSTFLVPAFYFTIHDSQGAPLLLDDILRTSLMRLDQSQTFDKTTFALTEPGAAFPLLSQGDHPVTGVPSWYFHPCETPKSVQELLNEMKQDSWSEDEMLLHWMKAWFLVLGTAIRL